MSSSAQVITALRCSASSFLYRDVQAASTDYQTERMEDSQSQQKPDGPTQVEIAQSIARARLESQAEAEERLREELESRIAEQSMTIKKSINDFARERKEYFARVESDVVHLALAIAAKILHREAQVDPLLIATLVRIAVNKLHDGSSVTVRVSDGESSRWSSLLGSQSNGSTLQVVEDPHLAPDDCILETDLGSANFSIDVQLKEVEQGFFDLLAQRPVVK